MPSRLGRIYFNKGFTYRFINSQKDDPFHKYLDKPNMHRLLPNLHGKSVLCLGCGSGRECHYMKERGAAGVVGIDKSKVMIDYAKGHFKGIEFFVMSLDSLSLPGRKFDVVYADMSVHYARSMRRLMAKVSALLKRNGCFIFSTSHPLHDVLVREPQKGDKNGMHSRLFGYVAKKSRYIIKGDYFTKRVMHSYWYKENYLVSYYYVPFSEIFESTKRAGLLLDTFLEPRAPASAKKELPNFYARSNRVPAVVIFSFVKAHAH